VGEGARADGMAAAREVGPVRVICCWRCAVLLQSSRDLSAGCDERGLDRLSTARLHELGAAALGEVVAVAHHIVEAVARSCLTARACQALHCSSPVLASSEQRAEGKCHRRFSRPYERPRQEERSRH
jgi:hypothetical protein